MEQLIEYIEMKLRAARQVMEDDDRNSRFTAQTFMSQAFGALDYWCCVNWGSTPETAAEVQEIWLAKYKKEFDNLIFGA